MSVAVAAGDAVVAGQRLLAVEAMKMENELRSPRAGTVDRVAIAVGQTVELGDPLVVLRVTRPDRQTGRAPAIPAATAGARPSARKALKGAPERRDPFETSSGIEIRDLYTPADTAGLDEERDLGRPGEYPFTRGVQPTMYRGRFWTMRQYAGFATAEETNARFRYLLEQGQTGLSVAFDLPTQMGYDSDAPEAEGEVGQVGVPISSLADMAILLDGHAARRGLAPR